MRYLLVISSWKAKHCWLTEASWKDKWLLPSNSCYMSEKEKKNKQQSHPPPTPLLCSHDGAPVTQNGRVGVRPGSPCLVEELCEGKGTERCPSYLPFTFPEPILPASPYHLLVRALMTGFLIKMCKFQSGDNSSKHYLLSKPWRRTGITSIHVQTKSGVKVIN